MAVTDADALSAGEKDAHRTTISVIEANLEAARESITMARPTGGRQWPKDVAKLLPALKGARIAGIAATVEYGAARR